MFWTRDILPFRRALDRLDRDRYPYYVQYTVNLYPPEIEPGVAPERAVRGLLEAAGRVGPGRVVWRFDPIFFAPGSGPDERRRTFARLARAFSGSVDTVMVSFLDRYAKVERRIARSRTPIRVPEREEASRFLLDLQTIARAESIELATCTEEGVRPEGVRKGACVDADRLRRIAPDSEWKPAPGGVRKGCGCAKSRDIGAYDTCPSGCLYCYAVSSRENALRRRAGHRADADRIFL